MQWFIDIFITVNMWMYRVILLHFGGSVSEQFELVGMRPHVLIFAKPSSFDELVARVRAIMNI
jgi:hypothetical protein